MTTPSTRIRAGDQDRERVATRLQEASGEGRLTLGEAEERLAAAYAATYVDELTALTRDLPEPTPPRPPRFPRPLRVHAAVVAVLSALLVVRFAVSDAEFFWPVFPVFWLGVSLLAHAAVRGRGRVVPY
ncbi:MULTISPECIES: DUF1707 SHOCT-like domain-containing protein [Amycolatopsis]|uniref:DUF1707 SHOCT-like domain-containing protein n=1 Tax=Amycolatopsis TaxID=1813 RepID=UPI000B8ACB9F|nr:MULTISPECIES: DUF1707 domain-containing protein [Amycolatopsis]OXM73833.1 hypothetical protein CF166_07800 [Amycolatopsis sp. KNN50.9b]